MLFFFQKTSCLEVPEVFLKNDLPIFIKHLFGEVKMMKLCGKECEDSAEDAAVTFTANFDSADLGVSTKYQLEVQSGGKFHMKFNATCLLKCAKHDFYCCRIRREWQERYA